TPSRRARNPLSRRSPRHSDMRDICPGFAELFDTGLFAISGTSLSVVASKSLRTDSCPGLKCASDLSTPPVKSSQDQLNQPSLVYPPEAPNGRESSTRLLRHGTPPHAGRGEAHGKGTGGRPRLHTPMDQHHGERPQGLRTERTRSRHLLQNERSLPSHLEVDQRCRAPDHAASWIHGVCRAGNEGHLAPRLLWPPHQRPLPNRRLCSVPDGDNPR